MTEINTKLYLIDNFLENPDQTREMALEMRYDFIADYPGMRSNGLNAEDSLIFKNKFEKILNVRITRWDMFDGNKSQHMNTCYQLCLLNEKTWVHHDYTDWAAVLYLTPNADMDSGTGFFRHIKTGATEWKKNDPTTDLNKTESMYKMDEWEIVAEVKNIYNRLILYKANQYHRSMKPGFGNNYLNGRLTQVFFFDV